MPPPEPVPPSSLEAIALIPGGLFVMTSQFEDSRTGVLARSVQPAADEPLLVSVSVRRGHAIEPLIRDSHAFAICRVDPEDKLVRRLFDHDNADEPEGQHDPFHALPCEALRTGSPILRRSIMALDCEVVRHFDLEADCELYVGQVVAAKIYRAD